MSSPAKRMLQRVALAHKAPLHWFTDEDVRGIASVLLTCGTQAAIAYTSELVQATVYANRTTWVAA
jgi:hypothetical protein